MNAQDYRAMVHAAIYGACYSHGSETTIQNVRNRKADRMQGIEDKYILEEAELMGFQITA
jgi:hypothetical protein